MWLELHVEAQGGMPLEGPRNGVTVAEFGVVDVLAGFRLPWEQQASLGESDQTKVNIDAVLDSSDRPFHGVAVGAQPLDQIGINGDGAPPLGRFGLFEMPTEGDPYPLPPC
jgi:hypothetical protein